MSKQVKKLNQSQRTRNYARKIGRQLIRKFVPKSAVVEILSQIYTSAKVEDVSERIFAREIERATKGTAWRARLASVFSDEYPTEIREFICNGQFAVFDKAHGRAVGLSYETQPVKYFGNPSLYQLYTMGPALLRVVEGNEDAKVAKSVEIDRLKLIEARAVGRSALVVYDVRNRPALGERNRWILQEGELPRKVVNPVLSSKAYDLSLVEEFRDDLKSTIAWKDEESFAAYLGYLLQPMLAHLKPGMNPAYLFRGPTNSGKGYLSRHLPGWLYSSNLESPAFLKKFPQGEYEFSVSMAAAKNALYYVFDEVKDISEEQTKLFDYAVTSAELSMRIMREGVQQVPNHMTFAMTGVYVNFSDETWGRLALVELTEGRTKDIEQFVNRWKGKAPDLLSSIFSILSQNRKAIADHPIVEGRRPGFGLVAKSAEIVFGLRPTYPLGAVVNDVLEAVCGLEANTSIGDKKGRRKRLSRSQIRQELQIRYGIQLKASDVSVRLQTAMGTGASRIYVAETGRKYKIDLASEGKDGRTFVYVERLKGISTDSTKNAKTHD